ncbi:hypothetical protein PVAP13_6KG082035 [Panicum virgatum]|uniref:Uncharacterized protein n=1 Tax=Panicum virgatum TaxID=38727 RepID=A0A8T0R853_PANVG|nr:hypothetical protein PVAP13_6KG082035 [Panicum virgatum]
MVSDGAVRGAAKGAGRIRRRRRRGDVSMGAPADFSDNTDSATVSYLSPMPDPLELELCAGEGPLAWVDPMLEELVASLVLTAGPPAVECSSPPPPGASHGVDALLGDSHSPAKGAHWTMDLPPLSPVQEGQPGAAVAMTDVEAATNVANRTPPQMSSADEPVRDTISGPELARPTSSSRCNVTVARGTREALLQLLPEASSPVKEVVANFAHDVCTEAPPPVLVASPPRRRSRQQPQDFTIRRNERLAQKSHHRATKLAVQAQNVMVRKLGLTSDTHPPDASSFQQFEEVFSSSLTVLHCEALDALLPVGMGTLATGV